MSKKIVVVGTGPASAFFVAKLSSRFDVIVLETGDSHPVLQDDNGAFEVSGGYPFNFKVAYGLGGASNYWGGGYYKYDQVDLGLSQRSDFDTWPINQNEINVYYKEALKISCGIEPASSIQRANINLQPVNHQRAALNVAGMFNKPNVRILFNARVVGFLLDEAKRKIQSVKFIDPTTGAANDLKADYFFLGAGTLSNLYLVHKLFKEAGYTPGLQSIGKNIGTHPKVNVGTAHFNFNSSAIFLPQYSSGISSWYQVGLSKNLLEEHDLPNHSLRFEGRISSKVLDFMESQKPNLGALPRQRSKTLSGITRAAIPLYRLLAGSNFLDTRVLGLRVRLFMDQRTSTGINLDFQSPRDNTYPPSRVTASLLKSELDDARDFLKLIMTELKGSIGLKFNEQENWASNINIIHSHFIGGGIMGTDPLKSAVDLNQKLHRFDNGYLLGPCIFPTKSYCNPFLTIAATSLRCSASFSLKTN